MGYTRWGGIPHDGGLEPALGEGVAQVDRLHQMRRDLT